MQGLGRLAAATAGTALLLTPMARAQANRVFASARSGSDANVCNAITTPCQTLQGAVNQVAAGGTVLVLDTGAYGPVSIGKALTIEAPTGIEAFIHPPSGFGIQIIAGGSDVIVLRGLTLIGGPNSQSNQDGYGIDFIAGGTLHVERCVVQGFFTGVAALRGSGTIVSDLYVEDSTIRDCSFSGIGFLTFQGEVRGAVDGCLIENSSEGLSVFSDARVVALDTVYAGNGSGFGVSATAAGHSAQLTVEKCLTTNNMVIGGQAQNSNSASVLLRVSDSTVTNNGGPQSLVWGGVRQLGTSQVLSRSNNTIEGNSIDEIGTIGTYAPK